MLAANKMNPDSQQKYNTLQQQSHYECFCVAEKPKHSNSVKFSVTETLIHQCYRFCSVHLVFAPCSAYIMC